MDTIKVTKWRYLWTQMMFVFLLFIAIWFPLIFYKYGRSYFKESINTLHIFLCSFGLYLLDGVFLKRADMPTELVFYDSKVEIISRFFFWTSKKEFTYEDTIITDGRVLSVHSGTAKVHFDPLLWPKTKRVKIIQAFQRHHVDVKLNDAG